MIRVVTPMLLGLLLLAPGCDLLEDDEEDGVPLAFEAVEEVQWFAVLEAGTTVFREKSDWEKFWTEHSAEPTPAVDFEKEMLIAAFWGGGYSGCASRVEAIAGMRRFRDRIEVAIGPLPDLGDCLAVVYPIEVVRAERWDLPVVFRGKVPE